MRSNPTNYNLIKGVLDLEGISESSGSIAGSKLFWDSPPAGIASSAQKRAKNVWKSLRRIDNISSGATRKSPEIIGLR